MTNEERVSKLEKEIRGFNLVLAGTSQIQGGFPELQKRSSIEERIEQIKFAHDNFAVIGGANAKVEGNLHSGLAINFKCPQDQGTSGQIIPPPPPPSECPSSVFLSITSSISIGCGCIDGAGGAPSLLPEEVGEVDVTLLELFPIPSTAWGPLPSPDDCLLGTQSSTDDGVSIKRYSDTGCGTLVEVTNLTATYWVARISGIWYCVIFTISCAYVCPAIFYGVGTTVMTDPMTNLVSCSSSPFVHSDPFYDWFITHVMIGWDTASLEVGTGGIVELSL